MRFTYSARVSAIHPALVVHVTLLLLFGKVQPVVQTKHWMLSKFRQEDVLKTGAAYNTFSSSIWCEPKILK